jgi:hypothetical protein
VITRATDVGGRLKVTAEPVRLDGERGAPTTSKPTTEVVPPELQPLASGHIIDVAGTPRHSGGGGGGGAAGGENFHGTLLPTTVRPRQQ